MANQLARQLGPVGGIGGCTQKWSTYTHMHDRLDKLRSALAEAQLKTKHFFLIPTHLHSQQAEQKESENQESDSVQNYLRLE